MICFRICWLLGPYLQITAPSYHIERTDLGFIRYCLDMLCKILYSSTVIGIKKYTVGLPCRHIFYWFSVILLGYSLSAKSAHVCSNRLCTVRTCSYGFYPAPQIVLAKHCLYSGSTVVVIMTNSRLSKQTQKS